jgi:hypothetical protein
MWETSFAYLKSGKILNGLCQNRTVNYMLWLQNYIHSKLKCNYASLHSILYLYFDIYFMGCLYVNNSCHRLLAITHMLTLENLHYTAAIVHNWQWHCCTATVYNHGITQPILWTLLEAPKWYRDWIFVS